MLVVVLVWSDVVCVWLSADTLLWAGCVCFRCFCVLSVCLGLLFNFVLFVMPVDWLVIVWFVWFVILFILVWLFCVALVLFVVGWFCWVCLTGVVCLYYCLISVCEDVCLIGLVVCWLCLCLLGLFGLGLYCAGVLVGWFALECLLDVLCLIVDFTVV